MLFALLFACSPSDSDDENDNKDIPEDPKGVTVPQTTINNVKPAATFSATKGNSSRIAVNLLGLINPSTKEPIELKANYSNENANIFLEEDNVLKGIKLTKVNTGNVLKADVVFVVDNSGSMSQEADSIAYGIIKFANFLKDNGLDAKFACLGYSSDVNGGIGLTDENTLETFLTTREVWGQQVYGTGRTRGFYGPDSAEYESERATNYWRSHSGENGTVPILFADSLFDWRSGAQRVFINFTDEPTQSSSSTSVKTWNTQNMCDAILGKASVHTVFSRDSSYYSFSDYRESPWEMSRCTGGTEIFIPQNAAGLDLTTIPVAGALSNSYKLEFVTSKNGKHNVVITIKENGADGKIEYKDITY